jgi:hypothetical protein
LQWRNFAVALNEGRSPIAPFAHPHWDSFTQLGSVFRFGARSAPLAYLEPTAPPLKLYLAVNHSGGLQHDYIHEIRGKGGDDEADA